jgi:hypothetical protein
VLTVTDGAMNADADPASAGSAPAVHPAAARTADSAKAAAFTVSTWVRSLFPRPTHGHFPDQVIVRRAIPFACHTIVYVPAVTPEVPPK